MCEWEGQRRARRRCVSMCVCVRYQFVQEHMLLNGFLFSLHLCIFLVFFECVCVRRRPPAPHHQDTGLNGGSYSPFPPHYCRSRSPLMCSFHCVSSSLSFHSSVRIVFSFYLSHALSLSLSPLPPSLAASTPSSLQLLARLASSPASLSLFFLVFFFSFSVRHEWLSAFSHLFFWAAKGQLVTQETKIRV